MDSKQIRQKFLDFFKERGHVVVPSSSLIPDDPSVLLTTAGMQQFKRYFTGELDAKKDFTLSDDKPARGAVSIQKSFRTSDIDEVGDETHLTFFEMLGHFSFGDYFKKETIGWTYELLTKVFDVPKERISAIVFEGDATVPFDKESFLNWSKLLPQERVRKGPRRDNFWGPVGAEGPCGACNEVYVDDTEVATLVFVEYYCHPDKTLKPLTKKGVDVGWGFERLVRVVQDKPTIFETDLFNPLMELLSRRGLEKPLDERVQRIIADHIRGVVFLAADGVRPSNKDAGYVLRRLMRRVITHEFLIGGTALDVEELLRTVIANYGEFYPEIKNQEIFRIYKDENLKFSKTLEAGLKELERLTEVDARAAFKLYESYGLPYEVIKEVVAKKATKLTREDFDREFAKHQEISRAGAGKKFGGHGLILDTGELKAGNEEEIKKTTRLHTATHLLNQALHDVLGDEVDQRGSDVTPERTRFDFVFSRKMTPEEIKKVENIVNEKIGEDLPVRVVEMAVGDALALGVRKFYKAKYPDIAKVYYIGKDEDVKKAYSKEFCGGPHVRHTGEIGAFKIIKEEAVSAGARRIRGIIE
jgi:alanyl-tRNA synthetase